jgi:hypothetical protein
LNVLENLNFLLFKGLSGSWNIDFLVLFKDIFVKTLNLDSIFKDAPYFAVEATIIADLNLLARIDHLDDVTV